MEQVYTPKQNYKVLVNCMTYNQSKYIEDALNGFAIQKTDFPFVCIVMDDASTDGEQEVIKVWMERECDMARAEYIDVELSNIILVPHIHNVNCSFAFYFLKRNLWKERELKKSLCAPWREHCEYEAICEGDDYWIHPGKLQMQAVCLDEEKDVGVCYTKAYTYIQEKNRIVGIQGKSYKGLKELFKQSVIPNVTTLRRLSIMNQYYNDVSPQNKGWLLGDYPIWLWMELNSNILFIDEVTSVYRQLSESASHSQDIENKINFYESVYNIHLFFIDKYKLQEEFKTIAKDFLARWYAYCYGASDRAKFRKYLLSCSSNTIKDYIKVFISYLGLYPPCEHK